MSPTNLATSAGKPPSGSRACDLRDLGLTCELLGREAVGFGAVAWLRIGPASHGLRTLATAGAGARALHIGETGQVPELQVENRGDWPLLLPAHVVLSGGWQTRAVERSVVVPGGGSARVPVKCVEAGRWAPRDEKTAGTFEVADRTGVRTRWSTSRSMADQLARHGRFAAEQAAVWQQVDEELTRSSVASRTRSYEAYLQGVKRRLVSEAKRSAVRPPAAANGVAIFPRGGGFWIEAYPDAEVLAEHSDDLLADLFDPEPAGHAPPAPPAPIDPGELLEAVWKAPLHPVERLRGTVGDSFAMADGPRRAAGAALMLEGSLVHLAVGAGPRQTEENVSHEHRSDAGPEGAPGPEGGPIPARQAHPPSGERDGVEAPHLSTGARARVSPRAVSAVTGSDSVLDRPRVDLETMRSIFGRARDLLPEGPPARERVQGFRLVRVLERNISWVDVRITGDGYAVLGSHDRCDLVLSNDPGVWLRHMAALCVRLEDDTVGLRLIDLKTDLPFFLDDDTARWSVLARGPFAMRLGRHVVCGFPIGPAESGSAQPAAPPAAKPALTQHSGGVRDPHATGVLETGLSISSVALPADARSVPGPNELSSFLPSAPVSQIQDLLGPSASPDHVRVTLERGGMGASVELPADALEAGVLLGRALNCFDGGLRRIFCEAISRAHVLIVRDRDGVFAFDLCSTNGTRVGGQRIRRHRLSDAGTTLELGKKVVFRWHRRD